MAYFHRVYDCVYANKKCVGRLSKCNVVEWSISQAFVLNMQFLCKIEDVFEITGRGCVVAPGAPFTLRPLITTGAALLIRNPNGMIIRTTLVGVEMLNRGRPVQHAPILLDSRVKKSDIELGAELYFLPPDEQAKSSN